MKIIFTSLVLVVGSAFAASPAPKPSASAQPQISPSQISVEGSSEAQFPLTPDSKKKLLKEYEKALATDEKALAHQERSALKELSAAQSARSREWREKEKEQRKQFFDKHSSGPDRRQYVQEFVARKKQFDQSLKDETAGVKKTWKEQFEQLKAAQKDHLAKFKSDLEQNKRPDISLWPKAH